MTDMPAEAETPEASPVAPEAPPTAVPAKSYMAQMQEAHDNHTDAVNAAHETLRQRMANAYEIFASDLDRAYKVWENHSTQIRQAAGLVEELGGSHNAADTDPTTAR